MLSIKLNSTFYINGINCYYCRFVYRPNYMSRKRMKTEKIYTNFELNVAGSTVSRATRLSIKLIKSYSL
jgi:hypothetical protein